MNISLHGLYVWKQESRSKYRRCFFTSESHLWVRKEEQQTCTAVIASLAMSDMLYPAIGICSLGLGWISHYFSLLGQSSFHAASWYMGHAWVPWQQLCLHPDWIDIGKQAVVLPMCLLPLPGFHLAPMLHVREQHITLKGLFSFKCLDFAEMMTGSSTLLLSMLCGSLFKTPACVHLTQGCYSWLNCTYR